VVPRRRGEDVFLGYAGIRPNPQSNKNATTPLAGWSELGVATCPANNARANQHTGLPTRPQQGPATAPQPAVCKWAVAHTRARFWGNAWSDFWWSGGTDFWPNVSPGLRDISLPTIVHWSHFLPKCGHTFWQNVVPIFVQKWDTEIGTTGTQRPAAPGRGVPRDSPGQVGPPRGLRHQANRTINSGPPGPPPGVAPRGPRGPRRIPLYTSNTPSPRGVPTESIVLPLLLLMC
jgi:hypothetical protein